MWFSSSASPSPLEGLSLIGSPSSPGAPRPVLPESDPGFTFFRGSMELMAVPKTKISPHKRRLRNGPKALKPVPVIIRCKSCGAVKLPHFYCCSGDRGNSGKNDSTS
ncbi:hypothetical protein QJS10_CPB21g00586 [Acorus calamus]|uniref:Large ribosomal subunit protein bL32m n=1 Tax=Acorus calamus TaxID=4465 RepID=A0AAV9C8M8_ACOCL|nr:hypothetical protein QJS10_CPB21g00586 [Acorus calamus]